MKEQISFFESCQNSVKSQVIENVEKVNKKCKIWFTYSKHNITLFITDIQATCIEQVDAEIKKKNRHLIKATFLNIDKDDYEFNLSLQTDSKSVNSKFLCGISYWLRQEDTLYCILSQVHTKLIKHYSKQKEVSAPKKQIDAEKVIAAQ